MLNRASRILLTQVVIAISLTACNSYTSHQKIITQMPSKWSVMTPDKPNMCVPINDEFFIIGMGNLGQGSKLVEARLDASLGHTYPTMNMPESVKISTDESAKRLTMYFVQPIDRSYIVSITCENGWWKLIQETGKQYMGDGGQIDEATRTILLSSSTDGALIVHVMADYVDSSLVVLKQHRFRESWGKYESKNKR